MCFLFPSHSYVRKAYELYFALLMELMWSKERILEVYLNVVEFGPGIYGAEAAAQNYFGVSAKQLSKWQAARLAWCCQTHIESKSIHKVITLLAAQDGR